MERFEADWLAARGPYDDDALDRDAVATIQAWAAAMPPTRTLSVVDLGSGTGAALRRAACWLPDRSLNTFAVDLDADLLAEACRIPVHDGRSGRNATSYGVTPVVADLLAPLNLNGGPEDGAVDLVLGHAIADLLPLDRLAQRVAALLRPGGLAHLALTYDGVTVLHPPPAGDLDDLILDAYHHRMDRASAVDPTYGGSTAGRRVAEAVRSAGLDVLGDAPSVWTISASDGPGGQAVLARLIRFVTEGARELGCLPAATVERWNLAHCDALAQGSLAARVTHRDVLARKAPDCNGRDD